MKNTLPFLMLIAAISGCSASASLDSPFASEPAADERPRLAAFAASTAYPTTQPSDDLRATALIDREAGTVRIINPTDQAIRDARIWINGSFVNQVDSIPAHGQVTLHRERFYNARGITMPQADATAARVQLETGGKFYNLLGPVFE